MIDQPKKSTREREREKIYIYIVEKNRVLERFAIRSLITAASRSTRLIIGCDINRLTGMWSLIWTMFNSIPSERNRLDISEQRNEPTLFECEYDLQLIDRKFHVQLM